MGFADLEEEDGEYPDAGVHAEWAEGGERGGRPDPEGHEVGDGGDGDGDPGVAHHGAHPLHQWLASLVLCNVSFKLLKDVQTGIINFSWQNQNIDPPYE